MVRPPCCDKLDVKRGLWTAEEDAKILAHVSKHGTGNWTAVPKKAGLRRCGKSCRLRWTNYLRPDLKHESFTPQEEELIVRLHATIGSRWSIIAQQLPGRTDNDVKNHWNTKLRKKLSEMGIDPVTHKPFSQILADYGNINGGGGLPNNGNRIGSLARDLKNAAAQEIFITHNPNNHDNPSMNLLTQLKSIKLVADASGCAGRRENVPYDFRGEVSPPPSPPTSFCWHEFLLEDAFLPSDQQEQENLPENVPEFSSKSETNADGKQRVNPIELSDDGFEGSSSCESSFLEAILDIDRENDMFLEFPGLLEES